MKRKVYSYTLHEKVQSELPERIKEAMNICGWNAFGIHDMVAEAIKQEKKETKAKLKAEKQT